MKPASDATAATQPWIVAVTGGIGSGKSTVASAFEQLGAHRIDADQIAHQLLLEADVVEEVTNALGGDVLAQDGTLDRGEISRIVFSDPSSLQQLEAIIHPKVRNQIEVALAEVSRMGFDGGSPLPGGRPLILLDIPLLESSPLRKIVDRVLFVSAPDEQREMRVQRTRGWPPGEREAREAAQVPLSEKKASADGIISNPDGLSSDEMEQQCRNYLQVWCDHIENGLE